MFKLLRFICLLRLRLLIFILGEVKLLVELLKILVELFKIWVDVRLMDRNKIVVFMVGGFFESLFVNNGV